MIYWAKLPHRRGGQHKDEQLITYKRYENIETKNSSLYIQVWHRFKRLLWIKDKPANFNLLKLVEIVALFLGVSVEAFAATYYVSPAGSDSNSGTLTAPFRTIQKAASLVNAGDTVIVKDGVYTDTYAPGYMLYLTRGGTASNPITFKSENKWGAVIDGQNANECVSFTRNANYVRIENFEIRNCTVGVISADNVGATHGYIYGNDIHHLSHHGIDLDNSSHNFTIDSNVIHDLDTTNPDWNTYGIYVAKDTSYTTVINNVFYNIKKGWIIHLYKHGSQNPQRNTKIINNTFAGESARFVGQIIIAAMSPNLLIENNIFYNPKTAAIRAYYDNAGKNIIVRNNITNVNAMCSYTYCRGLTFSNNRTNCDPIFVDPAKHDYHLQSASPAINKGTYYVGYDADRNTRVGNPDIGAYEYETRTSR
jgi:hypothetical protein